MDVISPPPLIPAPVVTETLLWSICSFATNPDKSSCTNIGLKYVNNPAESTETRELARDIPAPASLSVNTLFE